MACIKTRSTAIGVGRFAQDNSRRRHLVIETGRGGRTVQKNVLDWSTGMLLAE